MKGKRNQAIIVYNILRKIGLSAKFKGTTILLSAIMLSLNCADDFIFVSNIYEQLSKQYNLSPKNIENTIAYSLKHPIGNKYKDNFEEIFDLEYSEDFYSNKNIIEEVSRVIKTEYEC